MPDQNYLANPIAAETSKLHALRSATERTVALLKEHRAALIADATSGKINVRGAGHPNDAVADNGNEAKLPQ
jgi:type I restriction enzyme S subunit